MAFVQQQVCRLPVQAAPVLRFLDDLSHIRHAAGYGVKLHKSGMRRIGDDGGERRFAAPRRAVEDGGSHAVGLDGAAEQPPRTKRTFSVWNAIAEKTRFLLISSDGGHSASACNHFQRSFASSGAS